MARQVVTAPTDPGLRAYSSRWKTLVYLCGCLGFVAIGAFMIGEDGTPRRGLGLSTSTWGWFTIVFFGLGVPVFLLQLVDRRPRLQINADGLTYRLPGRAEHGPIPWTHIAHVSIHSVFTNSFLRLELSEPAEIDRLIGPRRTFFGGEKPTPARLDIPLTGLSASKDSILSAVDSFGVHKL